MPQKTGFEVLEWIRQQPGLKSLSVLMFTSSEALDDMEKARQLGTDGYLLKPSDPLKLVELVRSLHDRWLCQPTRPGETRHLPDGATQKRRQ
jgi:CheY-like chemotaxis protein